MKSRDTLILLVVGGAPFVLLASMVFLFLFLAFYQPDWRAAPLLSERPFVGCLLAFHLLPTLCVGALRLNNPKLPGVWFSLSFAVSTLFTSAFWIFMLSTSAQTLDALGDSGVTVVKASLWAIAAALALSLAVGVPCVPKRVWALLWIIPSGLALLALAFNFFLMRMTPA